MPIIDGKVVRARFTSLKLNEISSVDRPAQEGATAAIMKRANLAHPSQQEFQMAGFEKRITEIAQRDGCARHVAMSKARMEHPDEFAAYQAGGAQPADPTPPSASQVAAQKAAGSFMSEAHAIAKRDGMPVHIGMQRARVERQDLFAALN